MGHTILVALMYLGKKLWVRKYLTAERKSLPAMPQVFLKKQLVNPSSPGDFLSRIENKAALISSSVNCLLAWSAVASEIFFGKRLEVGRDWDWDWELLDAVRMPLK